MLLPRQASAAALAERRAAGGVALLVIDMISDWQFPDGELLLRRAAAIAPAIHTLKRRCRAAGVPTIYANDHRGHWRSNFAEVVEAAAASPGADIARLLAPQPDDYFVLKPKHSAFHATPLDLLLRDLAAHTLILTGVACDQCVLCTAADARMRDHAVLVPADCVASQDAERTTLALRLLAVALGAHTGPARQIALPGPGACSQTPRKEKP
jgi:nicotinamidase-related amidase